MEPAFFVKPATTGHAQVVGLFLTDFAKSAIGHLKYIQQHTTNL